MSRSDQFTSCLLPSYASLVASGCDRRLNVGFNGLNAYGCAPLPRATLSLGSCTCSSPSSIATWAAQQCWEQLRASTDLGEAADYWGSWTRRRLRRLLRLPGNTEIALTPSGTDVELLVLAITAACTGREIVNIIVGPKEVGSGTIHAAAGLYYDELLPNGNAVGIGKAIDSELADRVSVTTIDLREANGQMIATTELDAHLTQIVADAVSRNSLVLLHVVAHSKTGVFAPSWDAVDRIARHMKEDVVVFVDAAQGRLAFDTYRMAIERGYLVSFTGSKFFGGPPFSGALMIPPSLSPGQIGLNRLPKGFEQFFTTAAFPESWHAIRSSMPDRYNLGSLLRWVAAVTEIERYESVPEKVRERILNEFGNTVCQIFQSTARIELLPSFRPVRSTLAATSLENVPTVFSLRIRSGQQPLLRDQLKRLHGLLNEGRSDLFESTAEAAFQRSFHLGQPVEIGTDMHVLRVALGSPLMVDIATNPTLGASLQERLDWMRRSLQQLHIKLEYCLDQYPEFLTPDHLETPTWQA